MMSAATETAGMPTGLPAVLDGARLRVLRVTVLICLLISLGSLVGAVASFTPSGIVTGPATALGVGWCLLWAAAAAVPAVTAYCFTHWQITTLALVGLNAATVAATGGVQSPLLAVCMYVGWIASVVVAARAALVVALAIAGSIVVGYLLAGASIANVLTGPYRYGNVTNAVLPIAAGLVGVLLSSVTNSIFSRLASTLDGLRRGMPATTPALTALFAGLPVLESPAERAGDPCPPPLGTALTAAEHAVVQLLADGYTPKQIAHLRGVAVSTVRSQLKVAKRKVGARTLSELALRADI